MLYSIRRATEYIESNKHKVKNAFKLAFHHSPPIGWMNDPNGLVYYKEQYHIFYQYHPYDTCWGPMHWGHAVSTDLVTFQDMNVALAPDLSDENGCFSGGAIVNTHNPDELILMYTRDFEGKYGKVQTQGLVKSIDGINFVKSEFPVLSAVDLPENSSTNDFRDPKPVYIDGYYYIFIGSKTLDNVGQFLVYKSSDLKKYDYFTTIGPDPCFGIMGECPDMFRLNGKDVLVFSTVNENKSENNESSNICGGSSNSCKYIIGVFDIANKRFNIENIGEIDCGPDFYAAQTLCDDKGRRIMLAWMERWKDSYYLHKNTHGWNGALTFPRRLTTDGNILIQTPFDEIEQYYSEKINFSNGGISCKTFDAEFIFDGCGSVRLINPVYNEDYLEFGIDSNGRFYLSKEKILIESEQRFLSKAAYHTRLNVRLLLDKSSAEFFIDGGKETLTSRFYIDCFDYCIGISGNVQTIRANKIKTDGGKSCE